MQSVAIEGLRATLHPAPGRRGLLILGSPGFEDLCAHRFLAALAHESACLGMPALRYDLRGTGESAPAPQDRALVETWSQDLVTVARWMRQELGCSSFAIAGLRLGALLASGALCDPVFESCRLALLAPPASGKAYLRELKMFARVVAAPPTADGLDGLDLAGFHMPQAVTDGIAGLDWSGLAAASPRTVLVCGDPGPQIVSALERGGHVVTGMAFEGYDRLMCDPTASVVPGPLVRRVAGWLAQASAPARQQSLASLPSEISHDCWREEGVAFGSAREAGGILCLPKGPHAGPLVLFTNPGGIRRNGWGNMWVDMARSLAASGIASLRFDFSNLSADLDSDMPAFHYGDGIWREVAAAVDFAEARGFGPVVAVGACSGAYHCLRAAASDTRIEAAILVNQLCYGWSAAHALPLAAWMRQKAGDFDRKRRTLDEDVSEWSRLGAQLMVQSLRIAKRSAKGALRQLRALSNLMPLSGPSQDSSAQQVFLDLLARGCRVEVLQAAGDPSVQEYEQSVGLPSDGLHGLTRTLIPGADHLLTPLAARQVVLDRIEAAAGALQSLPAQVAAKA